MNLTDRSQIYRKRPLMIYELDGQKPDLPQEGRDWIAPSAAVIGKVRLKNDSSVWFNAVMRGPMKAAAREDDCLSRDQPSAGRLGLLNSCGPPPGRDSSLGGSTTSVSNSRSIALLINGSRGSFSIGSYQGRRSVALASTARAISWPISSPSNGTSLPDSWRKSWGQK
jgi:hypothetical protein